MMKNINNTKERGVALIFALGLLTLMSVFGVAFVTNSLMAQKTAANLVSRGSAKILLDSAINRVMMSIMTVLYQSGNVTDFSRIYSSDQDGLRPADFEKNTKDITSAGDVSTYRRLDQLFKEKESKLDVFVGQGQPNYYGKNSQATWLYLRDNWGSIIGRMAYQVLPDYSGMSLDHVLKGIYDARTKELAQSEELDTWNQRIGNNISEFAIGNATAFEKPWSAGNAKPVLGELSSADRIVSNFNSFFSSDIYKVIGTADNSDVDEQRQVWLKQWFAQTEDTSPEVFFIPVSKTSPSHQATAFHRFNVGEIQGLPADKDKWYYRFTDSIKSAEDWNSEKIVTEIMSQSDRFLPEQKESPRDISSGLNYLRIIGKSQGSFATLEDRRKQIAANLNDYCDEDSIPTSNISAALWSDSQKPKYTGNEKTPYINEFALGFKMDLTKSGEQGNINIKLTPEILTELIDIYGVTGASTTGKYNIKLWFKKNLTLKVVNASGNVTYSDNSTEAFSEVSCNSNGGDTEAELNLHEIEVASSNFSKGYFVARKELPVVNLSFDGLKSAIEAKLNDKDEKAVSKVEYTSLELEVSEIKFDLAAAALFDKTDAGKEAYGIDFVRGPGAEIVSGSAKTVRLKTAGTGFEPVVDSGEKSNAWQYFYLTGMEVRDPRQNLNFTKNTTEDKDFVTAASDWKAVPVIEHNFKKSDGDDKFKVGTIEIDYTQTTPSYAGAVNSCSNPRAPFSDEDKYMASGNLDAWKEYYDQERIEDPACSGENPADTTEEKRMSTAYIRNAPMKTLWELGVIHRGMAWQTLNIKRARRSVSDSSWRRISLSDNEYVENLSAEGVAYIDGDGIILEQTKLTNLTYTAGKLNVNSLLPRDPSLPPLQYNADWNKDIVKALFANIRYGHRISDLYSISLNVGLTGLGKVAWNTNFSNVFTAVEQIPEGRDPKDYYAGKYLSRADFVEGASNPNSTADYILANGFGLRSGWIDAADAQQEEFVGKTVNLLTAGANTPNMIQAVIVVQTIKSVPTGAQIHRPTYDRNMTAPALLDADATTMVATDDFDVARVDGVDVHYDEITGEIRALVTIKKVRDSDGAIRLKLYSIQYLGN